MGTGSRACLKILGDGVDTAAGNAITRKQSMLGEHARLGLLWPALAVVSSQGEPMYRALAVFTMHGSGLDTSHAYLHPHLIHRPCDAASDS